MVRCHSRLILFNENVMIMEEEMSELDLSRTVRFVSLDTHPANNSLVVTYEILVIARDHVSGKELCRRSKRDQFQISVSALDGDMSKGATLELGQIGELIISKCSILKEAEQAEILEDIQLNLLYLINRKQSQLAQPVRPPSSASIRSRSNTSMSNNSRRAQQQTTRLGSASSKGGRSVRESPNQKSTATSGLVGGNPLEVYQSFCERELKLTRRQDYLDYQRLDLFIERLDEHLIELEDELNIDRVSSMNATNMAQNLETQLENLYGEPSERHCAIAFIRRFVCKDEELIRVSSNRLLVCAILRILRDSEARTGRERFMCEAILYCFIRFTSFEDVFKSMALGEQALSGGDNESLDLIRVVINLLDDHLKWLTTNCENDFRLLAENSYYTNSLLVIVANILRLDFDGTGRQRIKQRLVQQHGTKLADILAAFLSLSAKHLARDIRTANKSHERLLFTLAEVFSIAKQLCISRDFIGLIRVAPRSQTIVDSLTLILNVLQLSRPGSGSNQLQQVPASDRSSLIKVYELEIESLLVINNLIYDPKLRIRLTRKGLLLKCVLRNLVVFLAASRKLWTMNPFSRSLVLIAPLKCLYELSCSDKIKRQLFESRIIVRCLLEYLLSSAAHLEAEIETYGQSRDEKRPADIAAASGQPSPVDLSPTELNLTDGDQIVLDAQDACQYIVSLWMNLSSKPEVPFYQQNDEEHSKLVQDYIGLAMANLTAFLKHIRQLHSHEYNKDNKNQLRCLRHLHLMNYIHAKLVRSMSQLYVDGAAHAFFHADKLSAVALAVLECEQRGHTMGTFVPLLSECLATLANVIESLPLPEVEGQTVVFSNSALIMGSLFGSRRRSLIDCSPNTEIETDDLLLVVLSFVAALARRTEICSILARDDEVQANLIGIMKQILDLRPTDTVMIISCLFTLDHLVSHEEFLTHLGLALDGDLPGDGQLCSDVRQLIENLCSLVMHSNPSVVQLSDQILSRLKQFEESRSLADSITGHKRFASYNNKWLKSIRANRKDSSDLNDRELGLGVDSHGARLGSLSNANAYLYEEIDEEEEDTDLDEDYRQLRTINEDTSARTCSRLTSTSSISGSDSRRPAGAGKGGRSLDENGEAADEEELDEEEEEETFSEPDVNVIDSMSMIGHLTNGRQWRGELSRF